MSCRRLQKQCYFCQIFAAKIGTGRSAPCRRCNRINYFNKKYICNYNCGVKLIRKCPAPIRCHNRIQDGTFASDWGIPFCNY